MKKFILVILLLIPVTANCQVESVIYKQIIDYFVYKQRPPNIDYSLKTTLIVLEQPVNIDGLDIDDYSRFKEKYKKLQERTFIDFIDKSQKKVNFGKISIPKVEFIVFERDSVPQIEDIILKYPHWVYSILEFSNVGINEEKNQVLVYYGYSLGSGVGGGIYLVYEKKKRRWKQKGFIPTWAG